MPESYPPLSRRKQLVFTLMLVGLVALICAPPVLFIHGRYKAWTESLSKQTTITPDAEFYHDDPELGFVANPGAYVFTERQPGIPGELSYKVTIGSDGYRITGPDSDKPDSRPEIWIFGCSFTWGQAINDSETYPYLIQQRFPAFKVRNFGENGYGTVHALLQLRRFLAAGRRPAAIVLGYVPWHGQRNVADGVYVKALYWFSGFQRGMWPALLDALSFYKIKLLKGSSEAVKQAKYHFPQAYLDAEGKHLGIRSVPLLPEAPFSHDRRNTEVTKAIFDEIYSEAAKVGVVPIVLRLWTRDPKPPTDDPLADYFGPKGFVFQDAYVDYTDPKWSMLPINGHPNPAGNQVFADKLEPVLKKQLQRRGGPRS